jgi:hypothetical protein
MLAQTIPTSKNPKDNFRKRNDQERLGSTGWAYNKKEEQPGNDFL